MSDDHKKALREGMYRRFYGENWQEIVEQRKEAKEANYKMPVQNPEFMGKRELLRLLVTKLRDPATGTKTFSDLARTYAGLKKWIGYTRANGGLIPIRQSSTEKPEVEETESGQIDDVNALIQQIEAERKKHG